MSRRNNSKKKGDNTLVIMFLLGAVSLFVAGAIKPSKSRLEIAQASINAPNPPSVCLKRVNDLANAIIPEIVKRRLRIKDTTSTNRDTLYTQYLKMNSFIASTECWQKLDGQLPQDLEKIWVNALVVDAILGDKNLADTLRDSLPPS